MTPKQVRLTVSQALSELHRAIGGSMFLDDAIEESRRIEREHRAMGRLFTDGKARYSVPVDTAAFYCVLRALTERPRAPRGWRDAMGVRADVLLAWGLADTLRHADDGFAKRFKAWQDAWRKPLASIDYATDIAVAP